MKTYYDLTKEERKNYEKEFKKTPGGKEMNRMLNIVEIIASLFIILEFLVIFKLPMDAYNYDEISEVSSLLVWIALLIEIAYYTYFKISFSMWLKNKYDIKRW